MTTQTPIKMKRLSIDVPAELHRDLMRYCIDHDVRGRDQRLHFGRIKVVIC